MGLFGGEETYVSSVVYNMAGPEEERVDYLKTTVCGSVISNSNFSISECLSSSYLNGPGIKARSFHRWARTHYSAIGIPTANILGTSTYDMAAVQSQIAHPSDEDISVTAVRYNIGLFTYWTEQWILDNYPERLTTAYSSNVDDAEEVITITWADETTSSFTAVDLDQSAFYFFVTYARRNATGMLQPKMWIYKIGSGNTVMDNLQQIPSSIGEFLPFLPVRLNSTFLSSTFKPDAYNLVKKAYKKATNGKKLDKLIEQIADNEDIDDVDHTYMVYGVSLNCKDNSAKKYLFKFFDFLRTAQQYGYDEYGTYVTDLNDYREQSIDYDVEREAFLMEPGPGGPGGMSDPGYTDFPPVPLGAPLQMIEIKSADSYNTQLNINISWRSINKVTGSGLGKPGAKKGEVWFESLPHRPGTGGGAALINAVLRADEDDDVIDLFYQISDTEWEKLELVGFRHRNLIKNGKAVKISMAEALTDPEESGFIVPLHYNTLRSMSLIDSTQMMTAATYLLFNCYEVVKQKWYETWAFKIFIFIVVIAIAVIFPPAGGTAAGLLGSAATVGAALGFVGLTAVIVGAIANAIAAMILMQLLSKIGTAVFGAKFGAIIATVAMVVAMSFGAGMMSGQTMASCWGNLMSASGIIAMTSAVGSGINGYVQASTQDIMSQTAALQKQYEADSAKYTAMFLKEFGAGDFHFDPTMLTNSGLNSVGETPQSFLDRTLMTGSDVAQMTNDMLTNMAKYTLTLNTSGS